LTKFRLSIKTYYGEMSVEGDSLSDFKHSLSEMGFSSDVIDSVINAAVSSIRRKDVTISIPIPIASSKPELSGIIEYLSDGTPHISVPTDKLSAKEVIALLLYAKSPNAVSMNELASLVVNNWKNVPITHVSANLSRMRAYVIKEGARGSYSWRLSGSGRNWVENELLPKLKPMT
jgi:hypothetical protein